MCLLEEKAEVDKNWMLSVAKEFNTPITVFLSRQVSDSHDAKSNDDDAPWFRIWYFTPIVEVYVRNILYKILRFAAYFFLRYNFQLYFSLNAFCGLRD